jgi:hypothetical protein
MSSSGSSSRLYHQPLNPFRTQPPHPRDDSHAAFIANPVVRTCYVVAVGILMIAVSIVACTTYLHLPSPQNDNAVANGPHRLAAIKPATPDVKILQTEIRSRVTPNSGTTNGVRPVPDAPSGLSTAEKFSQQNVRSRDYGRDQDDPNKEDALSYHHDDDEVEENNTGGPDDADELLLRPGEVHAKMLGETKDQVKLEIDQEEYSDHAFGVEKGHNDESPTTEKVESQKQLADPLQGEDVVVVLKNKMEVDAGRNDTATISGLDKDSDGRNVQDSNDGQVSDGTIDEPIESNQLLRTRNVTPIAAVN